MTRLMLILGLLHVVQAAAFAQEWRGIKLLKSNCNDVKQSLQVEKCEYPNSVYKLPDETVTIGFVSCPCPISYDHTYVGWNLPVDTVTGITRELHEPRSITEFEVNSNKWIKTSSDMISQFLYDNHEAGITLYALDEKVYRIRYYPTLEKYQHLRCPIVSTSPTSTTEQYRSVWLSGYGDVGFEEETTWLDKFAIKLKEHEKDSQGYIVAYGGCRDRSDEVQKRAQRAKAYLVTTYGIQNEDIKIINGGQHRSFEVELHVRGRNLPPPPTYSMIFPIKGDEH